MNPNETPLAAAIRLVGLQPLAKALAISYQAVLKWQAKGRMPRTEWTGETTYSETIERLTGGVVTKAMLLGKWPELAAVDAPEVTNV